MTTTRPTVYHLYDHQHLTGHIIRDINPDQVIVAWNPHGKHCIEWKDELRTTPTTQTTTTGIAA